jgi:hypothetical protein
MKLLHRFLVLLLSFSLLLLPLTQAQAAIVTNGQLMYDMQQLNDKESILQSINRADVQEQLSDMGVSAADLEERINQMTGEEIAQLNQQLNELPAGSGVLGIIVLVFIVFVITDVIGATNIFPFIHPVK